MNRSVDLLAELQRLAGLSEAHESLDTHLYELMTTAASLLSAESCTFTWLSAEQLMGAAPASLDKSDPWSVTSSDMLCAPIKSSGKVIGLVHARGPIDRPSFDSDDVWLLNIVTVYMGNSLHAKQLQNLLRSRFAQMALAQSVDDTVGRVLAVVQHPGKIAKILAKSFYREMTKAGFGTNEIIDAASQIISELSTSVKRGAKRRDGGSVQSPNRKAQAGPQARAPASGKHVIPENIIE